MTVFSRCFLTLSLAAGAFSQVPGPVVPSRGGSFVAPNKAFAFLYHTPYTLYAAGSMDSAKSLSFIPICERDALACVTYPAEKLKGTNFEAASFQVRTQTDATTDAQCQKFASGTPAAARTINGVKFAHATSSSVATGHSLDSDVYRAFHGGACYELRVGIAKTAFANLPAGTAKELTVQQIAHVRHDLETIMNSFRFPPR